MKIVLNSNSAIEREERPHATNSTQQTNRCIIKAYKRRAESVINDRSIDAQTRSLIRYALESWKSVPNAKSYVIESSTDPATVTSWEHAGIATSATKTISNLKSGTRFWFRVAAVGAGGQSGWSEQATKVAP